MQDQGSLSIQQMKTELPGSVSYPANQPPLHVLGKTKVSIIDNLAPLVRSGTHHRATQQPLGGATELKEVQ